MWENINPTGGVILRMLGIDLCKESHGKVLYELDKIVI